MVNLRKPFYSLADDPYLLSYGSSFAIDPGEFDDIVQSESWRSTGNNKQYYALKIYEELERDPHVFATIESRKLDVIQRDWVVDPASDSADDKRNAEMIADMLQNMSAQLQDRISAKQAVITTGTPFDQTMYGLLDSLLYGFSSAEIMWSGKREIYPAEMRIRHQRRFGFALHEDGWLPRLRTKNNLASGEPIPPRKFIFHHHQLQYGPYGRGLGHRIFWSIFFKRQDIKFWLVFVEKFASPTGKVHYPMNASVAEQDAALQAVQGIASETGIALPEGFDIELLEASRSGSIDSYEKLAKWCDDQVSEAILGQTGTTNQSTQGGSRARDEVAERVSLKRARADADLLSNTLNSTVVRWAMQLNVGGDAAIPRVRWEFPELEDREDLTARAQRDKILFDMGFAVTRDYVEMTYEVELADEKESPQFLSGLLKGEKEEEKPPADLAEPDPDPVEDYLNRAAKSINPVLKGWDTAIKKAVDESASFEELEGRLLSLDLPVNTLAALMGEALATAEAAGRYEVHEETRSD
jgi:phage gp29-like protein